MKQTMTMTLDKELLSCLAFGITFHPALKNGDDIEVLIMQGLCEEYASLGEYHAHRDELLDALFEVQAVLGAMK